MSSKMKGWFLLTNIHSKVIFFLLSCCCSVLRYLYQRNNTSILNHKKSTQNVVRLLTFLCHNVLLFLSFRTIPKGQQGTKVQFPIFEFKDERHFTNKYTVKWKFRFKIWRRLLTSKNCVPHESRKMRRKAYLIKRTHFSI